MSELRSSIRNRDEAWQDDFVMIGLDTFGDGRFLVNVGANAAGSQLDMKLTASGKMTRTTTSILCPRHPFMKIVTM